jgi:hypothetical protein
MRRGQGGLLATCAEFVRLGYERFNGLGAAACQGPTARAQTLGKAPC